ncbi:hypothetical protein [Vibrio parahaemolyticus]|uniref:hypothetical protein n=1 Tax=Vibrio parahaemolyticus TaxID=670 RepID=UPI00226B08F2|nr:hypothetical protein [Vibrio parahaemolyticus]MCX8816044.1 hypothetical protein [Vibrio parahaemolyticus]
MKILLSAMALAMLCMTTGCVSSIINYRISNGNVKCPPQVMADMSIGVSMHINENAICEQPKTETTEEQQSVQKSLSSGLELDAHRESVGVHGLSFVYADG